MIQTLLLLVGLCSTGPGALGGPGVRLAVAAGPSYAITALGTAANTTGGLTSLAYGINAAGQVVGYSYVNNTGYYAFLWSPSTGMIDLGTLPGDATSIATAINSAGQVVGIAFSATVTLRHAFLWSAATGMQDLNTLIPSGTGWILLEANAINDSGQVVGLGTLNGQQHAFLWSGPGAAPIDLGTLPGGAISDAGGINATGQVVGLSYVNSTNYLAFRWSAAAGMTGLGTLGGTTSEASGINVSGQVAGRADTSTGAIHAFRTAASSAINPATDDLGTLGGTMSEAFGINTAGQVVGDSTTGSGAEHAFVYSAGTGMQDLNTLIPSGSGWVINQATGINDNGQIVGFGTYLGGTTFAVLLAPQGAGLSQTITFAPLPNHTYGEPPFTVSATASSGLPVAFSAGGNCTIAGTTVTITGVGSCTVTASQPGDGNYNAAPDVPQSFSIGKATPVISWSNPADIVYGTPLGAAQLDATAPVPGTFVYTPSADTVLHAGGGQTLSVTFTPTDTADYNSASAGVSINVTRAPLTVTANNQSMVYGGTVPPLTATYSGFVNGDAAASLGGALSCTTTATAASPAGAYPISCSGLTSPDYSFTYVPGTLTITKATATLALSNLSQTYSGSPEQVTVTTTPAGLSGVSVTYNGSGTAPTNVGSYSVVASLSNPNYQAANATGTLVIARAATTTGLTSSRNPSKFKQSVTFTAKVASGAGTPGGSVTFLDGGTALGTAALSAGVATFSTKGLSRGTHSITAVYAGSTNFGGSTSAVLVQTVN